MEPFKNIFNKVSINKMANIIHKNDKNFNKDQFVKDCLKGLNKMELKQRVEHIAQELKAHLNSPFKKQAKTLIKSLSQNKDPETGDYLDDGIQGFLVWPFTHFIHTYGQDEFDISMMALEEMTKRFTAEFAIRYFLENHYKDSFKILKKWKKSDEHHLRRLVSEGTRPRLPWGIKVQNINDNLEKNIQLIYSLRKDPSEYVRRSVANHLNDISYLDEGLFFKTLNRMDKSEYENWVKRHASRSLLKKGHPKALLLHGYNPNKTYSVKSKLGQKAIKEGDRISLDVSIKNTEKKTDKALIEYCIHYLKKNGQYSVKPFRLRDTTITDELKIRKDIHFKKVTTRVHYPGKHFIEIQINGKTYQKLAFQLTIG